MKLPFVTNARFLICLLCLVMLTASCRPEEEDCGCEDTEWIDSANTDTLQIPELE